MRSRWLPEELQGYALVWCAEIVYAGRTLRMATQAVEISDVPYPPTMSPASWSRQVTLFATGPELDEISISGWLEANLAELHRQGHRLSSARAEVFQVRVRPDGSTPDTYATRCALLTGPMRATEFGERVGERSFFAGTIYTPWPESTETIPPDGWDVNRSTWGFGSRADSDDGVCYPVAIGYPGRDDYDPGRPLPAAPVAWVSRDQYHVLIASVGPIAATSVKLIIKDNPEGTEVDTSTQYTNYAGTLTDAIDANGVQLAVVDFESGGYNTGGASELDDENFPGKTYATDPDRTVFISFTEAGGAGLQWRGRTLRAAGDVLGWALERTGWPVDWGRTDAAAGLLARFNIDTMISLKVGASAWLRDSLLPLLPVALRVSPRGLYPLVWRPDVLDVAAVVDLDASPDVAVSDVVSEDASDLINRHTLRYGYSAYTEEYRYIVRVGIKDVDSTDHAGGIIRTEESGGSGVGSGGYGRVYISAVEAGIAGASITVNFTGVVSGAAVPSENTTTRTVTIEGEDGETAEQLAARINAAGLTLVTATGRGGTSHYFLPGAPAQSFTLVLTDFGVQADAACRRSYDARSSSGIGARNEDLETYLIYDHATARAVLAWRALAYGSIRRRVTLNGPEHLFAHLELLDAVKVTSDALGIDGEIGWVEQIESYSDGQVAFVVVFLDR